MLPADAAHSAAEGTGFFGKLPSHGDFISRRLPPSFREAWAVWLDTSLERSREMLGETWLEAYLSSPIWCFAGSIGCVGRQPFAGVLMPSLDRIGRYYPLSILALTEPNESAAEIAAGTARWFARIEAIALSCLADAFDFEAFDAALAAEPPPPGAGASPIEAAPPRSNAEVMPRVLGRLLEQHAVAYSLWWTSGSTSISAGCRAFLGLPPPEDFHTLLR
jgi:type VI secretion system protein ImpM